MLGILYLIFGGLKFFLFSYSLQICKFYSNKFLNNKLNLNTQNENSNSCNNNTTLLKLKHNSWRDETLNINIKTEVINNTQSCINRRSKNSLASAPQIYNKKQILKTAYKNKSITTNKIFLIPIKIFHCIIMLFIFLAGIGLQPFHLLYLLFSYIKAFFAKSNKSVRKNKI